jgi:hypothetical protein
MSQEKAHRPHPQDIIGGKDKNGCIPAAGEIWCTVHINKCLSIPINVQNQLPKQKWHCQSQKWPKKKQASQLL